MTWDGEGRRPIRDKQAEKDRLRKLCLAVLSEPGLRILHRMELPAELVAAFKEAAVLESFIARRRKERRIVELLRRCPAETWEELESLIGTSDTAAADHERFVISQRQRLLEGGREALTSFVESHPGVNVQRLRQLVRNAAKAQGTDRTSPQRDLDGLLREVLQASLLK
jgi:ribosome-associated protein